MYLQCTSLTNWKFEKELQKVTPIFLDKKRGNSEKILLLNLTWSCSFSRRNNSVCCLFFEISCESVISRLPLSSFSLWSFPSSDASFISISPVIFEKVAFCHNLTFDISFSTDIFASRLQLPSTEYFVSNFMTFLISFELKRPFLCRLKVVCFCHLSVFETVKANINFRKFV